MWRLFIAFTLILLASGRPLTIHVFQDTSQSSHDYVIEDIKEDNESDGAGEYGSQNQLFGLWSSIEAAFQFLGQQPMEKELRNKLHEYLQRDRAVDKSKKVPVVYHNFVRFGKRNVPGYNSSNSFNLSHKKDFMKKKSENSFKRMFKNDFAIFSTQSSRQDNYVQMATSSDLDKPPFVLSSPTKK